MAGMDSTWGSTHLERGEVWNNQLKEMFFDELYAQQWVNFLSGFPDGNNFQISSMGELTVDDMQEGVALPERRPDTGQFQFNITEFKGVKVSYTDNFIEDDFLAPAVLAKTPMRMKRAFDEDFETAVLALQSSQTADDTNTINGAKHRYVATGTSDVIAVEDFARAKYALKKAHVPMTNLIAIVDPSVEYTIDTISNITNISNNPRWEGIIEQGIGNNFRFVKNIYGFDVYTSEYLAAPADTSLESTDVSSGYKANMFFSAADKEALPFVGAWRRAPRVRSWRDENIETEYHQLSARYGLALYRPENLVTVMSSTSV